MWMYNKPIKKYRPSLSNDEETSLVVRRISISIVFFSALLWLTDYLLHGLIFFYLPFTLFVLFNIINLALFVYFDQKTFYTKILSLPYYPKLFRVLVHLLIFGLLAIAFLEILIVRGPMVGFFAANNYWTEILKAGLFIYIIVVGYVVLALKFKESEGRLVNQTYAANFFISNGDLDKQKSLFRSFLDFLTRIVRHKYFDRFIIILIFLIFIAYRVYVMVRFPLNFPDEFTHAFAGLEWLKAHHFPVIYSSGEPYMRGSYVSAISGFFLTLLGKKIWVMKLTPLLVGIADFWLVYLISKRVIGQKFFIYVVLLLFILNPWTALNHFYLRMYVFYELFLLLLVFLLIKTKELLDDSRLAKAIVTFVIFAAVNYLNYFWSFDEGRRMILLASCVGLVLLSLSFHKTRLNPRSPIRLAIRQIVEVGTVYKLLLIAALVVYAFFRFNFLAKINFILSSEQVGSFYRQSYFDFFYKSQTLVSMLFLISLAVFFLVRDAKRRLVILTATVLVAVHLLSGSGMQIIRGLIYLVPLFIIVSIVALDYLYGVVRLNAEAYLGYLTFSVFVATIFLLTMRAYPVDFASRGFYLPGDLGGANYGEVYNFKNDYLKQYHLIQVGYQIPAPSFFNTHIDYELDLSSQLASHFAYCRDGDLLKECYFNTPVIQTMAELDQESVVGGYCLITNDYNNTIYFSESNWLKIAARFPKTYKFTDYDLYCN